MYSLARKLLFLLNAETAHELSLDCLGAAERLGLMGLATKAIPLNEKEVMGIKFPNPVGLAAGLDKNGDFFNALGQLGFGFIEIGTVTPLPQAGNPAPRLFRLIDEEAIINRMGFNNKGVDYLVKKVAKRRYSGVLGINIGKNKATPDEKALSDYQICMNKVYSLADYIAINISSPNTPGLRKLQFGKSLEDLLDGIKETQAQLAASHGRYVPVAVKIAPDVNEEELIQLAQTFLKMQIDGVVATNTTIARDNIKDSLYAGESGGLSGKPLMEQSSKIISGLVKQLQGKIPVIGVGGIACGDDALEKIHAGADLVQLYSGFIYRGPRLIAEAADALASAHAR